MSIFQKVFLSIIGLWACILVLAISGVAAGATEVAAAAEPSFWSQLWQAALPQVIALITSGLGLLVVFARSKTGKLLAAKIDNELIEKVAMWFHNAAWDLVAHAEQTVMKALRADLEDGRITSEEFKRSCEKVKEEVLAKLVALSLGRLKSVGLVSSETEAAAMASHKIEALVEPVKAVVGPPKPSVSG